MMGPLLTGGAGRNLQTDSEGIAFAKMSAWMCADSGTRSILPIAFARWRPMTATRVPAEASGKIPLTHPCLVMTSVLVTRGADLELTATEPARLLARGCRVNHIG